jgi:hypothetical protein
MHWLGKRSLVDFSATVGAIATRVPGLVALDVGDDMGGSGGRWGVRGAGERGQNVFFSNSNISFMRRPQALIVYSLVQAYNGHISRIKKLLYLSPFWG